MQDGRVEMRKLLENAAQKSKDNYITGYNGKAELNNTSQEKMVRCFESFTDKYTLLDGLQHISPNVGKYVAEYVSSIAQSNMDKKFHDSLNFLEKGGLIKKEKLLIHEKKVNKIKGAYGLGVYTAFSLAPFVASATIDIVQKKNLKNFIIGSYAYINGEMNSTIRSNINDIFNDVGIKMDNITLNEMFNKYRDKNSLAAIPNIPKKGWGVTSREQYDVLAKSIAARCNILNYSIKDRAGMYLQDVVGYSSNEVDDIINDAENIEKAMSDIRWFAGINFRYFFNDFISNAVQVANFSQYSIEADQYAALRNGRKEKIINTANLSLKAIPGIVGLFTEMNPIAMGITKAATSVISSALTSQGGIKTDYNKALKIIERADKLFLSNN